MCLDLVTKICIFARVPFSSPTLLRKGFLFQTYLKTLMEVKLWNGKREKELYDNLAELFAFIKATEKLEKAYIRDIISAAEYESECQKLIAQFKTLSSTWREAVPNIEQFHDTYRMDLPAGLNRLVTSGVPATAMSTATSTAVVAESLQNFITAMDSLKLNMVDVDQVHPLLSDLSVFPQINYPFYQRIMKGRQR